MTRDDLVQLRRRLLSVEDLTHGRETAAAVSGTEESYLQEAIRRAFITSPSDLRTVIACTERALGILSLAPIKPKPSP